MWRLYGSFLYIWCQNIYHIFWQIQALCGLRITQVG